MAKNPKPANGGNTPAPVAPSGPADVAELFRTQVLAYGDDYKLPLADIVGNVNAVRYLLQNGFSQSMTDATAFSAKDKEGKSEAELDVMRKEARDKRFAAIRAGDVGTRVGGPKLAPVERVMRDVAEERLRAIAAQRNVAMPKGDTLKAALDKIIARDPDGIRTEAETRIAAAKAVAAAVVDTSDDDLFAPVASAPVATETPTA